MTIISRLLLMLILLLRRLRLRLCLRLRLRLILLLIILLILLLLRLLLLVSATPFPPPPPSPPAPPPPSLPPHNSSASSSEGSLVTVTVYVSHCSLSVRFWSHFLFLGIKRSDLRVTIPGVSPGRSTLSLDGKTSPPSWAPDCNPKYASFPRRPKEDRRFPK